MSDYLDRMRQKKTEESSYLTRMRERNAQSAYDTISRDIDNISSITGSLYNDTYNRYKDGNDTYRADSKDWLDRTASDAERYQASSAEISRLLDEYDGVLDPEWSANVRKAMDSYSEGIKKITESAQQEDGFWSNFKDEAEYTDYRNKATADLDALGREIDDLEATWQKANEYSHGRVNQTYWAKLLTDKGYSGDTEGLNKLQADIAEKKAFRNSASVYQGKGESADLAKLVEEAKQNPDFAKYSAEGANIENPSYNEAQPSSLFRRSQEVNNPVTFSRENTDAYAISGGQYAPRAYNHDYQFLTEDEVDAYNYYLAAEKAGLVEAGTADNFLKEAEEVLNQRSAEDLIKRTPNNLLGDLLVGMYAGGEQFTSGIEGIKRFITDSGEYAEAAPISKGEFALSAWEQNLPDNGWGKVRKGVADLTSTITNQIPSIMTSAILSGVASPAVGETVGAALMGAGAAGNAYNEFVRQGYSTKQARLYGTLIGISETCLEKAIGGISAFGAGGAKISDRIVEQICKGVSSANARIAIQFGGHVAAEMLSEGIEEFTQDVLEPYFQALVTGGKPEAVDWEQAAYSGLLGALSAGLMNGTQGAIKTVNTVSNVRNINGTSLKNLVIENFSEDSLARQYAMELGDNPTTWQKAKLLYEVESGFEGDMVADLERELMNQGVDRATAHKQAQDIGSALTSGRDIVLPDEETANAVDALSTSILARLSARNSIGELTFAGSIDAKTIAPRILELTKPTDTAFDIANTIRKQGATVSDEFANDIKQNLVNVGVMEADAETMVNEFRKASVSDADVNKDALSVPDLLDRAVMDALVGNITESERIKADIDKTESANENADIITPTNTNEEAVAPTTDEYTKDEAGLTNLLKKLNVNADESSFRYDTLSGDEAKAYLRGLESAYTMARSNVNPSATDFAFKDRLTESEIKTMSEFGRKAGEEVAKKTSSVAKGKGSVRGYNITVKELQEGFNANQKTAFRRISAISQAKGVNLVLFDSKKSAPPELKNSNGAYSPSTRTLYLDISAGVGTNDVGNLSDYTLIQTFSHEFTHVLENDSPSQYREFQKFIFDKMTERGQNVNDLIESKMVLYGEIDYDGASREVVAESMVNILSEEKVLEDLYDNHLNIFQKIFKALQDFVNELKEYFERTFKHGNTPEAQAIMDGIHYVDGVVDEFIKLMNAETATETSAEEAVEGKPTVVAGETQYSIDSLLESVDLYFAKDGQRTVLRDAQGNEIKEVTHAMVAKTPFGAMLREGVSKGINTVEQVNKEIDFMRDLVNQMLKVQDVDLVWAVNASLGFQPNQPNVKLQGNRSKDSYDPRSSKFAGITTNSDPQYGTTIDFTTICRKTQSIIDVMSKTMMKLGRGLTEDEIVKIVYKHTHEQGEPVPCPVCYVFSRWVGLGGLFDNMKSLQNRYPKGATAAEEAATIKKIKADMKPLSEKIAESLKQLTGDKKTAGKAREKARKELAAEYWDLQEKKRLAPKKFTEEQQSRMEQIGRFLDYLDNWTWMNEVRLSENYTPVPDNVLFDINAGQEFANTYPESWKFRTTRGPAMGKAASPYTPLYLGQIIRGIGSPTALGKHTVGMLQYDPFLKTDKNGNVTPAAKKLLSTAIRNAKKQNIMGGQRLQSTSDFRFEYALDYLMAFYELQTVGSFAQLYTKVPEAVPFLASVGAEVNCSLMPLGDGYVQNKDGSYTLVFSDVTGMHPDDAFRLSAMFDNVQPIMVGINDTHILLCMADDRITFIIPYHASGNSESRYREMMRIVGENVTNRDDYSPYQVDTEIEDATDEQKAARNLRINIITGKATNLTDVEKAVLKNNETLRQLYIRFYGKNENGVAEKVNPKYLTKADRASGVDSLLKGSFLSAPQAKMIMPYEYWDKTLSRDQADVNGRAFAEYCESIGMRPRFSGWNNNGVYHAEKDFSKASGYWKTLIDRPMYNRDGTYHEQKAVDASNVKMAYLDATESSKGVVKKSLENNAEAINRAVDLSIADIKAQEALPSDIQAQRKVSPDDTHKLPNGETVNTLDYLNEQEKEGNVIHVYKTYLKIGDGLYPPMASMSKNEGGKYELANPLHEGEWAVSTESPNEVDKNKLKTNPKTGVVYGTFKLKKLPEEGGGVVEAAYNPYQHASNLMINDQFEAGSTRPNLVTYECIIPTSELTSGYRAEYAKDPVGKHSWHEGTVAGQLPDSKQRFVYMSRWMKPIREVPNSEVAAHYKSLLEGVDVKVPFNVVTPGLLAELEKIGVPIDYYGSPTYRGMRFKKAPRGLKNQLETQVANQFGVAEFNKNNAKMKAEYNRLRDAWIAENWGEEKVGKNATKIQRQLRAMDNEYLELAKDPEKNEAELSKMVEEVAKANGYDSPKLYHGTQPQNDKGGFGFAKFDLSKMDDGATIFLTDNDYVAESYAGTLNKRNISGKQFDPLKASDDAVIRKFNELHEHHDDVRILTREEVGELREEYTEAIQKAVDNMNLLYEMSQNPLADEMWGGNFGLTKDDFDRIKELRDNAHKYLEAHTPEEVEALDIERRKLSHVKGRLLEVISLFGNRDNGDLSNSPRFRASLDRIAEGGEKVVMTRRGGIPRSLNELRNSLAHELTSEADQGIYSLYAKTEGLLRVDANERNWDELRLPKALKQFADKDHDLYYKTREIAALAKKAGYNGVIFEDIIDVGEDAWDYYPSDVYALFDPENVKSADPVTYDSDGNVIPLSERFNPANNDLRYQLRQVEEIPFDDYEKMEKHFGTTNNFNVAGYLLRDGKMLDFSGKHWGDKYSTFRQVDHRDIQEYLEGRGNNGVNAMIDMLANGNIRLAPEMGGINLAVKPNGYQTNVLRGYITKFRGEVMVDIDEVGGDTIHSFSYPRGTSADKVLNDINAYFDRGVIPNQESVVSRFHIPNFEFQRRNDWRLGDWEILSRAANNLESSNYNAEQKKALAFFQSKLTALQNLQEKRNDLGSLFHDQMFTKGGDKKAAQNTLKQMHALDAKIEKAANEVTKATEPKVVRDLLKEARSVIETQEREHGAELLRRYRDRRDNSEAIAKYKKRVLKDSHELQKWITNPDDKAAKRVPDVIKNSVIDFLSLINETSTSALKGKAATQADYKFAERLRNLRDAIKTQAKDLDGLYSGYTDLPEDFFDEMEYFINMVGSLTNHTDEFVINAMTSDELKRLSATITAIKHYVQLMNAFQANAIYQHVFDAGDDTISYLEQMKKAGFTERGIFNYFTWTQMRPAYAWARFGKGGLAIFDELRRAQDTLAFNAAEIIEFTKKLYTDKEVNEWTKETKTFDINGDKVEVPVSFIMSLYELMKQEDSRRHIETNGLRFAAYSKGARKIADEGHVATYDKVMEIIDSLTDRQKEVADGLQRFMATRGAEWGNYVSMKRFGREAFSNLRYFPISSDGRYLESSGEEKPNNASLYALLNMSFTKARNPHANNRLVVYDIFDVFANHMASMAQYNAFALPILDTLKWLNYSTTDMQGNPLSIKDEMARVYGTPTEGRPGKGSAGYAERFVTNILKAFNGTETQANPTDNVGLGLLRRYNQAQIAYNLRVVVQQPMAIVRAASILPGVTLAKGALKNLKNLKANIEEMQKYSGIAKLKSLGYYDTNVSPGLTKQIKHDENFLDKAGDIGMKPAEFADDVTWAAIWVASKEQARGDIEKAVEIFEDVIYKTQVVDSVLTKTEFMRNKGGIARILSSFMSEPVTTASMMVNAIEQFNRDRKSGMSQQELWKRHGKNFARVTAVYAANAIVLAVAEAAMDALRDDSDDPYLEKYGEKFWENFLDEISPFAKYPIIKDIEEMVKGFLKIFGLDTYGYQPRTITGQGIEQFLKGTQIIVDKIDGQKKGYTWYAGIYKLLQGLSGLTGTHFGTITREVITTWNTLVGGMNPSLKVRSYVSNDDLSGMIVRAAQKGDSEALESLRDKYYTDEDAFKSAYKSAIGNAYIAGEISAEEASKLLERYQGADEAHWQIDRWNYKAENGTSDGYKKYNDFFTAVETGQNLKAVIKEYTDNGVDKKTLASQITSHFKPIYTQASKAEKARLKGYLLNAYEMLGYNRKQKSKDIDAWG